VSAPPPTLIVGSEQILVDRAIRAARKQAGEHLAALPERRDVSLASEEAVAELREALSPTLFADPVLLVISDADEFDDATFAVVEEALSNPTDGIALAITHPGGVKGKRYLTALRAAGAQEVACPALKKGRPTQEFLANEVRRHGRKTTSDAMRALYEAIGHNIPLLVGAIDQLCTDVEANPLTEEHVRSYFAGVADMQGYSVSDAVLDRRPVDALRDVRWVSESTGRNSSPLAVTAALASAVRQVARVQSLPTSMSEADIMRETGIRLDFQVRNARARGKRWRPDRLARAAVLLGDLDIALKGGLRAGEALEPTQKLHELENYVVRTATRGE